jgi:hypothetical protein
VGVRRGGDEGAGPSGTQAEPPAPLVTFTPTRCWSQRANSLLRLHRRHAQYMAGLADLWHPSR